MNIPENTGGGRVMAAPGAYVARAETIWRAAADEARQMAGECDARAAVWGRSSTLDDPDVGGQFQTAAQALRAAAERFEARLNATRRQEERERRADALDDALSAARGEVA